ncbi:MAG: hypothetical protein MJ252_28820, partial [archaeon]|nr:hypothetical protein [archaeon]
MQLIHIIFNTTKLDLEFFCERVLKSNILEIRQKRDGSLLPINSLLASEKLILLKIFSDFLNMAKTIQSDVNLLNKQIEFNFISMIEAIGG